MKKKYQTKMIEVNDREVMGIMLTEGEFSDILFTIDKVEFGDERADGTVVMHFNYDIIDEYNIDEESKTKFEKEIGDLIVEVLEEQVENGYDGEKIAFTGGVE